MTRWTYDAAVVGAGPNGLAAAVTLARAGCSVIVYEQQPTPGGGARSAELTLPGFTHDLCSAIYPLAAASPVFRRMGLASFGLHWIEPEVQLAHPFDDGSAARVYRSVHHTAASLGRDGLGYTRLVGPLSERFDTLVRDLLRPIHWPHHPLAAAGFGLRAVRSAERLARSWFERDSAKALFAGAAAHSGLRLHEPGSAAVGLVLLGAAHAVGWPLPEGGAQRITEAMVALLRAAGGTLEIGVEIRSLDQLDHARLVLLDVTPRQLLRIAGDRLNGRYARRLERFRYGPGVFKIDWALAGPIPWAAPACGHAGTVHLGGTLGEIAAAERAVWRGEHPERPFVLLAQQSLFDPTRAPPGMQTGWAYCHVPRGSTQDMTAAIERQVERFAPGFTRLILARRTLNTAELQRHNANLIGGDISGGLADLRQLIFRPVARLNPYTTPDRRVLLCSSSTPPGPGVHGLCGYFAAKAALKRLGR